MRHHSFSEAPHLIIERGYWRDPVQLLSGLTWFAVGLAIGAWLL